MLAAESEARRQKLLGHLGRRELPKQLSLLVAQAFLLEARRDPRPQQHGVDRLEQIVLGAHLDAPSHAVDLFDGRHDNDGDVAQLRVRPESLERLVAVHLGHLDVEQHEVGRPAAQHLEG